MAENLRIELDDADVLAALDRAIAVLQDTAELNADIGAVIEKAAALRFETKTDPEGNAWAPLSPATVDIYTSDWFIARNEAFKGGIPGSLLQRTNALRQSLAFNAGDGFVEIGTNRLTENGRWQVGELHEWGTRKMPRRGFLVADPLTGELGAGDQAEVLAVVERFISGAFG